VVLRAWPRRVSELLRAPHLQCVRRSRTAKQDKSCPCGDGNVEMRMYKDAHEGLTLLSMPLPEFPRHLAASLFPGVSCQEVLEELCCLAGGFYGSRDFVDYIKAFFPEVLAGSVHPSKRDLRRLDGLAFETVGANANWAAERSSLSRGALLIWVSCLSLCVKKGGGGPDASFGWIPWWVTRTEDTQIASLLRQMTGRFILAHSWEWVLEAVFAHLTACVVAGERPLAQQALCMKRGSNATRHESSVEPAPPMCSLARDWHWMADFCCDILRSPVLPRDVEQICQNVRRQGARILQTLS